MGMKSGGGEIVQVQGGHIVRATGRKDRHSKVFTSKGPRDRRVRLSAHTAIQFYDVQDRLGYDRPSKAVDWLINKAKSAIDKLDELPPWQPSGATSTNPIAEQTETSGFNNFQIQTQPNGEPNTDSSSFVPPQLHADPAKSFFPTSASSSSMNFPTNPSENLGLSLQSLQEPSNNETLFENPFRGIAGTFFSPASEEGEELIGYGSALSQSQREPLQFNLASARGIENLPVPQQRAHYLEGLPGFFVPGQFNGQEAHGVVFCRQPFCSPGSSH